MIEAIVRIRNLFLVELYKAADGIPYRKVSIKPICETLGLTQEEALKVWRQLSGQRWVESSMAGDMLAITDEGAREAERIDMSEFEQRRFAFLKAVYDLGRADPTRTVSVQVAANQAGIDDPGEIRAIYLYLAQSGLVKGPLGMVKTYITVDGIDEIEAKLRAPAKPTQHFHMNIGTLHGNVANVIDSQQVSINQSAEVDVKNEVAALEERLKSIDGGELQPSSRALLDAIRANEPNPLSIGKAAEEVAAEPEKRSALREFAGKLGTSAAAAAVISGIKWALKLHGIDVP